MKKTKVVLFDIDYTLFDTDVFKKTNLKIYKLYSETPEVLRKLSEVAEIGIFSKGEDEFQREKLKQTLIANHFQKKNIHIFLDKNDNIENVLEKYKGSTIFLVDDKLKVLKLVKNFDNSVVTIWIKRGPFMNNREEGFMPDIEIQNLKEIIPVIHKA